MSQTLPNLGLPVMQPSQAQKHVTHNEALNVLDTVTQLCVLDSTLTTPPLAQRGDRYLVPNGGVDAWENHEGALALFDGNVWLFVTAQVGWLAFDQSRGRYLHIEGGGWVELPQQTELANLQNVGINSTADATNRLSISAPASLYSHEGAGHQIKVNKASTADTASLLFQTNWSGHAEMGLNGSNSWSLKISPNGFIAPPVVSGGAVSDVANLWVSAGQATTSVSSAVAFAHVSATGGSFRLTAIGRWF